MSTFVRSFLLFALACVAMTTIWAARGHDAISRTTLMANEASPPPIAALPTIPPAEDITHCAAQMQLETWDEPTTRSTTEAIDSALPGIRLLADRHTEEAIAQALPEITASREAAVQELTQPHEGLRDIASALSALTAEDFRQLPGETGDGGQRYIVGDSEEPAVEITVLSRLNAAGLEVYYADLITVATDLSHCQEPGQ